MVFVEHISEVLPEILLLPEIIIPPWVIPLIFVLITRQTQQLWAFIQKVVSGTPAEEVGLKAGDIVTKIDDEAINETNTLAAVIRSHKVGDKLVLTVDRNGESSTLTVTLGEAL